MKKLKILFVVLACAFIYQIGAMNSPLSRLKRCYSFVVAEGNYFVACLDDQIEWGQLKSSGFFGLRHKRYQVSYEEILGGSVKDVVGHFISEELGFAQVVFKNGRLIRLDLNTGRSDIKRIPNPNKSFLDSMQEFSDSDGFSLPSIHGDENRAHTFPRVSDVERFYPAKFIEKIVFAPSGDLYAMLVKGEAKNENRIIIGNLGFKRQESRCAGRRFDTVVFSDIRRGSCMYQIKGIPLLFDESEKYLITDDKSDGTLFVYDVAKMKERLKYKHSEECHNLSLLSAYFVNIVGDRQWIAFSFCGGGKFCWDFFPISKKENCECYLDSYDNLSPEKLKIMSEVLKKEILNLKDNKKLDREEIARIFNKRIKRKSLPSILKYLENYNTGESLFRYLRSFKPGLFSGTDYNIKC